MKHIILTILLFAFFGAQAGNPNLQKDKEAIKAMCGCYKVEFNFAETFAPDTSYKIKDPYHAVANAEWVFVAEENENKISLQHLLIIGPQNVIKHWSQDWIFENRDFYDYNGDFHWTRRQSNIDDEKGKWTQKVYQVDNCIRYEASAPWIHEEEGSYWTSEVDAPLPRRENTKRSDYNVMHRRNRQEITDYGWLHEQDNTKIIRKNENDQVLVMEKGYNTYTRIADSECKSAKKWWKENEEYWALVKAGWSEVLAGKSEVILRDKVDDEKHFEKLMDLQYQYDPKRKGEFSKKIREVIEMYVVKTEKTEKGNAVN